MHKKILNKEKHGPIINMNNPIGPPTNPIIKPG
jgi:hypothetical protein